MKYEDMVNRHLDVRTRGGDEWQCLCPFHDDSSPSFSVNVSTGLYICYACGAKGNGKSLAIRLGERVEDAAQGDIGALQAKLTDLLKERNDPAPHKRVSAESWTTRYRLGYEWELQWQERLGADYSPELADQFALGYDMLRHELVIPIFDWHGSAESCVRRRLGDLEGGPKYLYSKGFKTSQHLYGAWQARAASPVRRPKTVAIVEGTIDALSMWAIGVPAVALLGSQVSATQKRLLHRLDAETYVCMTDRDTAGARAEMQIEQALRGSGCLFAKPRFWPKGAKDVAEMSPDDRRASIDSAANALTSRSNGVS